MLEKIRQFAQSIAAGAKFTVLTDDGDRRKTWWVGGICDRHAQD
jgi:hypothetical protein